MCLGSFDTALSTRAVELVKTAPTEEKDATTVHELLIQALAASQSAPNRAVKRRVRQRLHKKLGAVCNKEEFEDAMEQFKVMELQQEKPKRRRESKGGAAPAQRVEEDVTPAVPPVTFAQSAVTPLPPKPSVPQVQQVKAQAYVAVPIFYQANNSVFMQLNGPICAVQSVRQVSEEVKVTTESVDLKQDQQASTTEDDTEVSSLSSEEPKSRSFEGWPTPLPVERTFIQFSTRAYIARRRSRSM